MSPTLLLNFMVELRLVKLVAALPHNRKQQSSLWMPAQAARSWNFDLSCRLLMSLTNI